MAVCLPYRFVTENEPQLGKPKYPYRPFLAFAYLFWQIVLGGALLISGLLQLSPSDKLRFASFLASAAIVSALKVRLPGVTGTVSVSFLFVLSAIVDLSYPEALAVGAISILAEGSCYAQSCPRLVQICFNLSGIAIAIAAASLAYSHFLNHAFELLALTALSLVYYFANTSPVTGIVAPSDAKSILKLRAGYGWRLPYYLAGSLFAWLVGRVPASLQWEIPIVCLPIVYLVHRSYRNYVLQIEHDRKHFQEMNNLHLKTIEALALAIDAKDHATHDHLQRVQLYAVEIGKDLGLSARDLDALRAAAVLHDIGKLAVPDSIISKPGKLTRAEFDKMKVHPVVGGEILERVEFPYPVVPIVRAHHEKWNGTGYPDGLRGEQIPIGARILAAVDALDALASDRQYRRALPLDEAMALVASEAGTSFDPAVVKTLSKRYRELERRAQALRPNPRPALSKNLQILPGGAPATGFEQECTASFEQRPLEVSEAGHRVSTLQERLAVVAVRLENVMAFDAIAFFSCEDSILRPEFTAGNEYALLGTLRIPLGEGVAGWVAEAGKPILNGSPAVDPGYTGGLRSVLAIPLVERSRTIGVLAVYRTGEYAFTAEELTALMPFSQRLAWLFLENQRRRRAYEKPSILEKADPDHGREMVGAVRSNILKMLPPSSLLTVC